MSIAIQHTCDICNASIQNGQNSIAVAYNGTGPIDFCPTCLARLMTVPTQSASSETQEGGNS